MLARGRRCVHRSVRGVACHSCWLCLGFRTEEAFLWVGEARLKLNGRQPQADRRSCTGLIPSFLAPDFKIPNTGEGLTPVGHYLMVLASYEWLVSFWYLYSAGLARTFMEVCLLSVNCWPYLY